MGKGLQRSPVFRVQDTDACYVDFAFRYACQCFFKASADFDRYAISSAVEFQQSGSSVMRQCDNFPRQSDKATVVFRLESVSAFFVLENVFGGYFDGRFVCLGCCRKREKAGMREIDGEKIAGGETDG